MLPLVRMLTRSAAALARRAGLRGERAASAVEYGILVSLIAAAVVAAVFLLGGETQSNFDCTAQAVETHVPGC